MINWRKPVIYSLLYLSGSKIPKYLEEIKRVDSMSDKEKKKYQEDKLKKLLLHSYENVPYYTKVLAEAGVVKDGKVHLENFSKIPILTKGIIRKEKENLLSKDYKSRKPYENSSGGSTGEPVRFIQDKEYNEWNIANKIYYKIQRNYNIGNKELRLWGSEKDVLEEKESFKVRIRNFIFGRKEINSFNMSLQNMKNYYEVLNSYKPSWVEAYAHSIYEFAVFLEKNNLRPHTPKGIICSAGNLYPHMKQKIEEVFLTNVYNRYGSREVGDCACTDNTKNGFRLSIWNQLIEVDTLNQNIYVTPLNNYSMPMVRYDIGDKAQRGNKFSYLYNLEGRETTVFKTANGKIIPGEFFIHFVGVVFNKGDIGRFQVIQKDYKNIIIKITIRDRESFMKSKLNIENSIKKVMGKVNINWKEVSEIKPLKNGKYLYIVSELK